METYKRAFEISAKAHSLLKGSPLPTGKDRDKVFDIAEKPIELLVMYEEKSYTILYSAEELKNLLDSRI